MVQNFNLTIFSFKFLLPLSSQTDENIVLLLIFKTFGFKLEAVKKKTNMFKLNRLFEHFYLYLLHKCI